MGPTWRHGCTLLVQAAGETLTAGAWGQVGKALALFCPHLLGEAFPVTESAVTDLLPAPSNALLSRRPGSSARHSLRSPCCWPGSPTAFVLSGG